VLSGAAVERGNDARQ